MYYSTMVFSFLRSIKQSILTRFSSSPPPPTISAYRLYTGTDDHSYVETIQIPCLERLDVSQMYINTTPPGSVYERHNAPQRNFVLTLSGTLEFTTSLGETFILKTGDILLAEDVTGHGHSWRMLGDEPWVRVYITLP